MYRMKKQRQPRFRYYLNWIVTKCLFHVGWTFFEESLEGRN